MAKGPSKALPSSSKAGRLERISDRGGLQRCHRRSFRGIRYGVRRSSGCPWLEKSQQTTAAVRVTAWDIISGVDSSDDGMTRAAAQGTALAYLLRDASTCVSGRSPSRTLPACCRVWRAPCGIGRGRPDRAPEVPLRRIGMSKTSIMSRTCWGWSSRSLLPRSCRKGNHICPENAPNTRTRS